MSHCQCKKREDRWPGRHAGSRLGVAVSILLVMLAGCSEWRREGGAPASADRPGNVPSVESENAPGNGQAGVDAENAKPAPLEIVYPLDEALFPPDIVAPTFRWEDNSPRSDTWSITFQFSDGGPELAEHSASQEWTPSDQVWETIKQRSAQGEARVTIRGLSQSDPGRAISQGSLSIRTSEDPVAAPLFYREVNLPFRTAVKDPAAYIRWRFGPIWSKQPPPIVLEKLPVCGNCHSFSADGSTLALEVDSGNDKGSYAIAPIEREIVLDQKKLITWSDYRREDGDLTFGLLCQVSPDGRYVVGTVKDRALAVYRPDLMFSQLFFLVKGILAIYDREENTFRSLPGADDPQYVQTNATWSPDGKTLVFARCRSYEPEGCENIKSVVVPPEAAEVFLKGERTFQYDLYRIPFNDGKGGTPEPVEGASNNGMSNYFAKFSPDGKWIAFCKAKSFMLLQPDSELYIIPAEGGEARRLRCNTWRMNSWHSWSPNGKWLVFSSKAYSPYTQLFLTHIDEQGRSSVPVVLSRFTEPERAANIPEFVNARPDAIGRISEAFLDDLHYYRAGFAYMEQGDPAGAIPLFRRSLEIDPKNTLSHLDLAHALFETGNTEEAKAHLAKILEIEPNHAVANYRLAAILRGERKLEEAADHFRRAIRAEPNLYEAHASLGVMLLETGHLGESAVHLAEAVRLEPVTGLTNYHCGTVFHARGDLEEAVRYYHRSLEQNPEFVPALLNLASIRTVVDRPELYDVDEALALAKKACDVTGHKDADALKSLAGVYAAAGQLGKAVDTARKAEGIALAAGQQELAQLIHRMLRSYERFRPQR